MKHDSQTLNFAAAVMCGVGSFASLVAAAADRKAAPRSAMVAGVLGTVGAIAWAAAAYQDLQERNAQSHEPEIRLA